MKKFLRIVLFIYVGLFLISFNMSLSSLSIAYLRGYPDCLLGIFITLCLLVPMYIFFILKIVKRKNETEQRIKERTLHKKFLYLSLLSLLLGCFFSNIWRERTDEELFLAHRGQEGVERLERFRAIDSENIQSIILFDERTEKQLKTITDRSIFQEFSAACKDVKPYTQKGSNYNDGWYVIIDVNDARNRYELLCYINSERPNNIDMDLVVRKYNSTRYYGNFTSVKLREWFEKYVINL